MSNFANRSFHLLALFSLGAIIWNVASRPARAAEIERPNIVMILTDDLGWTDVGCFGSSFYQTPNIDKLAQRGMKFTSAYASCTVCSPTRASLLTGQYPARLHITDWIPGHTKLADKMRVPDWTMHLPLEEPNLAKTLGKAGYVSASIGKWHLGGGQYLPDKQGFALNLAGTDKGQPPSYVSPYRIATLPDGPPGEFLTDRESIEATKFIEQHRNEPFFLYLPHHAVHQPIDGKTSVIAKYRETAKPDSPQHNPKYAALVESVDDSVGRVVAKLEELKLTEKTIVIFTSDNGGLLPVTSNLGIRAGKGSAYEGGVRVPLIYCWPSKIAAGTTSDVPTISADFYPTMLAFTGVSDAAKHTVDGESLEPVLRQSGALKRDAIYWHYPHYHPGGATPYSAMRAGDWKLIEFFEKPRFELYNLKTDQLEAHDLATEQPDRLKTMSKQLADWRKEVGAQMATMK